MPMEALNCIAIQLDQETPQIYKPIKYINLTSVTYAREFLHIVDYQCRLSGVLHCVDLLKD